MTAVKFYTFRSLSLLYQL